MSYVQCPVIVIGPPRSGTSVTAKVLQEHLGIRMVDVYLDMDHIVGHNPYESYTVALACLNLSHGSITWGEWKETLGAYIDKMQSYNVPWGLKDPRIVPFLWWIIEHLKRRLTIIRCKRKKELTIGSMKQKFGWPRKKARKYINHWNKIIDGQLLHYRMPHVLIEYKKKHFDEQDIADFLEHAIIR